MIESILDDGRCALVRADAAELLAALPDRSVDLVLTDPPYANATHANLSAEKRADGRKPRNPLAFRAITPDEIRARAADFVRVGRGWILVFCDYHHVSAWGESIEAAGGRWPRVGYWVKTNPMPQMTGDRPALGAEAIVIGHALGEGRMTWNGGGRAAIWRGGSERGEGRHPTQKPAWLMQALAGLFAPAGGLVLDPYCGSGSTGVGALSPERFSGEVPLETHCAKCAQRRAEESAPPLPDGLRFLGGEIDPTTVALARARLLTLAPAATRQVG